MLKEMTDYFVGEKQESVLFMLAALMALGLAIWLWTQGHRLRLMALPLVVVALMQLVVGVTIFCPHRCATGQAQHATRERTS